MFPDINMEKKSNLKFPIIKTYVFVNIIYSFDEIKVVIKYAIKVVVHRLAILWYDIIWTFFSYHILKEKHQWYQIEFIYPHTLRI